MRAAFVAALTDCIVSGNSAGISGGGIYASELIATSTATLTRCTVSGNRAGMSGGGIGGNTVSLGRSTISGNFAVSHGGGIHAGLAATVTRSTVSGNSTDGSGGGISISLFSDLNTATVTRSTVSGNRAGGSGGGIDARVASLTNSTLSGNSAGESGGGLRAIHADVQRCTIADNFANTGGGLFHEPGGNFNIRNTIVALNLVDFAGAGPDVAGPFTSQGHNLIGDGSGSLGFTDGVNGDIVGTNANPIDPKLGPLANNGGRTRTHALKAGSRAIDRGDNSLLPQTDQRGLPRTKDGNGDGIARVDIGAFEK
jgi:predicted outer membrane repeat protein